MELKAVLSGGKNVLAGAVAVWLAAAGAGMWVLAGYEFTLGDSATPPAQCQEILGQTL